MNNLDKKYVIFLDIDGTLMGSDQALKRNIEVIQKVRALGHKVLVNTGRSTACLPTNIDFEKDFDGVISGAGARVILDGKEIFCKIIQTKDIKKYCAVSFKEDNVCVLEGIDKILYVGVCAYEHPDWIPIYESNVDELVNDDLEIEKFTVWGSISEKFAEAFGDE